MKLKKLLSILMITALLFAISSCGNSSAPADIWKDAQYSKDTTLGNGDKTVTIKVEAEDKSVVFTIKTDKKTVGEALLEHKLISGDEGPYGMYVKKVNGILADYDVDQTYWSFSKDGEYMTTGVDMTEFSDRDEFELVYTKE